MTTNFAIALVVAIVIWLIGTGPFLLVNLPVTLIAGSVGVWLFYVQHQFDSTFWACDKQWAFHDAALYGSSHYHLPGIFRWFTANIGIHHVHHLCSRIPYYRLPAALRELPALQGVSRLTMIESFRCVRLALWDERQHRLISFQELRGIGTDRGEAPLDSGKT
jgi:omega-6 fatty acid desaturase (delta-12 desaturase)